jgi:hypothetical protein
MEPKVALDNLYKAARQLNAFLTANGAADLVPLPAYTANTDGTVTLTV